MPVDSVASGISSLPAVLTGPILRRLTGTSVAVWLALPRGSDVTLQVFEAPGRLCSASIAASGAVTGGAGRNSAWCVRSL